MLTGKAAKALGRRDWRIHRQQGERERATSIRCCWETRRRSGTRAERGDTWPFPPAVDQPRGSFRRATPLRRPCVQQRPMATMTLTALLGACIASNRGHRRRHCTCFCPTLRSLLRPQASARCPALKPSVPLLPTSPLDLTVAPSCLEVRPPPNIHRLRYLIGIELVWPATVVFGREVATVHGFGVDP